MKEYNLPINYTKLSPEQRREVRLQYIEKQNGVCMYCKGSLSRQPPKEIINKSINWKLFPENFLKYPIHLQHDHNTDMTEGAVHSYCNAVMWQYDGR
jgi:hypothetical protein